MKKRLLSKKWVQNLKILDIAFQPILNIHTGQTFAVEALLRNYEEVGFGSIFALFDAVYEENLLYAFDLKLRKKALKKFVEIQGYEKIKLFYNLDNRLLEMSDFSRGNTVKLLERYGMSKKTLCFEISERHEISNIQRMQEVLTHYKEEKYCIAVDDFGVGYSGYKLLYDSKPDIIKIDRFFLTDIHSDVKKKVMTRSITHLAIQLGIKVIAEGIQTKEELLTCRDIGCHFIQGYLIQKPTKEPLEILSSYPHIVQILSNEKRASLSNYQIEAHLDKSPSLQVDTEMLQVIHYFQKNPCIERVVVVNEMHEPVGVLLENKIKEFIYSPYGRSLMSNSATVKFKLKNLIQPCGTTEVNTNMSTIIELFSNSPESAGIILTNNAKYYGCLSARAIITIMNEQNLLYAREQNPLTKLPGNSLIEKYISEIGTNRNFYILCYFDLDNFKAFNDVYGFRNGDRAIILFADILKKNLPSEFFKAHIGGDDFFIAVQSSESDEQRHLDAITAAVLKFCNDARDLYSQEDKERGYILSSDREGNKKKFPLLSVSASVLMVRQSSKKRDVDSINEVFSFEKKIAKQEASHISLSCML